MREYIPNWSKHGISKERYLELLNMCRQYPQWVKHPAAMTEVQKLKAGIIEDCASSIDNGVWKRPLIVNVCYDLGYTSIDPAILPSLNRNAFFRSRINFFVLLDEEINKRWLLLSAN